MARLVLGDVIALVDEHLLGGVTVDYPVEVDAGHEGILVVICFITV
jgi:hypothetical protein